MKIFFFTFGCKVNTCETEAMIQIAKENGYTITDNKDEADIVVVNSCTVTANSDRKVYSYVKKVKLESSNRVVVLVGCLPQAQEEIKECGADIVIGNSNKLKFIEYLKQFMKEKNQLLSIEEYSEENVFHNISIPRMRNHTRQFLKIEDGCDRYCAYCIVPFARGNIRSLPLAEIEEQALLFSGNNCKEIVLTGINLSSYGKGSSYSIVDAVKAASVGGINRIRLSSVEPDLLTDSIIEGLSECENLCSHFHLSLQSGSNNVLEAMNRRYTAKEYLGVIEKIKESFPTATFTTDVMVGFPTETDRDHQESMNFIKSIGFLKCHVFTYSPRLRTKAALMKQISVEVKKKRMGEMLEVAYSLRKKVLEEEIGKTAFIIVEDRNRDGYYEGYTDRYIPVRVYEELVPGDMVRVKIISAEDDYCTACSVL